MAENETPVAGEQAGETPPASQTTAAPSNPQPAGETPAGEQFDQARAQALIAKLRDEARVAARAQAAAETRAKQFEDAQLSEQERVAKRLAETEGSLTSLQAQHRQTVVGYEVRLAAHTLGIVDPDAAAKLLDQSALQFDEDGHPTNAADVLKTLVEARPWLKAVPATAATPAPSPTAATNPGTRSTPSNVYTTSQISDRKFWEANRPDIERAMKEGRIIEG